ncbi:hypothetical protein CSA80_01085 [Candidatus Saccharibacteria bacterium]|nr:MAG: hypothetical protein CR973_02070 [Candidatus Saccharibacteria bacterium]PID99344.1 MAG: hypothetical protein CSA80_01085 [Candidatus Saccharibacteria bacterium]
MPEIIAQGSLIGAVPEAVSIEVSNADLGEGIFRRLREDIMRYAEGGTLPIARTTYSVVDKLYKKDVSEDVARTMQNFEPLPDGSVPVLVGENSYKRQTDYLGFRAVRVTT